MKSFSSLIIFFFVFNGLLHAQKNGIQKAVISTPTVNCEDCKSRIENRVVHEYGVSSIKADFRHHSVTAVWYTDRTNIENIKTALANLGYDADDVKADPDSFKKLPKTCQHHMGDKSIKPRE